MGDSDSASAGTSAAEDRTSLDAARSAIDTAATLAYTARDAIDAAVAAARTAHVALDKLAADDHRDTIAGEESFDWALADAFVAALATSTRGALSALDDAGARGAASVAALDAANTAFNAADADASPSAAHYARRALDAAARGAVGGGVHDAIDAARKSLDAAACKSFDDTWYGWRAGHGNISNDNAS